MAVALDTYAGSIVGGGTSKTVSYTTAGSNRALLTGVGAAFTTTTGVTYNSVSMTAKGTQDIHGEHSVWALVNPASGANNLVYSFAAYASAVHYSIASFTGADQTTAFGTEVVGTVATTSPCSTGSITCPTNGMVYGSAYGRYSGSAFTINAGTLLDSSRSGGSGKIKAGAYRSDTGSLAWNFSAGYNAGGIGVPINAAASGTTVSPTTGSIIVAGSAPTVKQNILRQPTVGSVVVAGSAPTVKQNILRQPTVGSVVVTGNAPTLVTNTLRQPAAGSVIVAGNAPSVVTGGDKVVNPNTGTIVVSGLAPTLVVNTIRQPTVGSITVAGLAPTVRQGVVRLPTVGSIVVSGLAPTVSYTSHVVRTPSAGTITVAGNAPTIIGASIWTNVSAASTIWTNASAASTTWTNQ